MLDAFYIIKTIHFKEEQVEYDHIVKNLDRIISHSPEPEGKRLSIEPRNLPYKAYRIAAVVALIISTVFAALLLDSSREESVTESLSFIKKQNPKGQKSSFLLPDSTRVILNAESSLSYPEHFSGKTREIKLIGEAFFEVRRNEQKPFVVTAAGIATTALGTSFNVRAFENDETISVSLSTGKVVVENKVSDSSEKVFLVPGEKYVYDILKSENKKVKFDIHNDIAWKEGVLYFNQSNLNEFISTIERWYNVRVTVIGTPRSQWKINGRFNNESLYNVLESLSFARQIKYTLKGKNVILYF